jgi:Protein of unknown function (DUF3221)
MKLKALLLVAVLAAVVCARADDPEPAKKAPPKASIRGKVSSVTAVKVKGLVGRMSVDGKKEKDTEHDRASVKLTPTTKFYKWVDGKKKDAKFADVKKGSVVQCTFVGPVLESYPVQATAGEVLILEEPKKKE